MGEVATKVNARRRRLGVRLRRLRERAGLSIEQAAPKLDFSPSKLSRIENGHLLQRTSAQIDKQIKVRLIRQRRLTAEQEPLELHAIIDEAVLRRPVGNRELMRAQQKHVVEIAELPNVTVQVLPTSGGSHVGMVGAFTILSFPEKGDPDVAFVDHVAGALHLERESDVRACTLTFDRLRSDALSPSDSIVFIRQVAESREPDERGDPSARGGPVPRSVAQE